MSGHLSEYVTFWGPVCYWSAYSFEDMNGFVKKIIHGSNKIGIELMNTLTICNAYKILQYLMQENTTIDEAQSDITASEKLLRSDLNAEEIERILEFCQERNIPFDSINFFAKVKAGNIQYTSTKYKKQKKRNNFNIYWRDANSKEKFGIIELFIFVQDEVMALIRELVEYADDPAKLITNRNIRFEPIHTLIRETFCFHLLPVRNIEGKLIRIQNYVCIPDYVRKK